MPLRALSLAESSGSGLADIMCVYSHLFSSPPHVSSSPYSFSAKVYQYHIQVITPKKVRCKERKKVEIFLNPLNQSVKQRRDLVWVGRGVWRRNGMNLNLIFHVFGCFVVVLLFLWQRCLASWFVLLWFGLTLRKIRGFIWMKTLVHVFVS